MCTEISHLDNVLVHEHNLRLHIHYQFATMKSQDCPEHYSNRKQDQMK